MIEARKPVRRYRETTVIEDLLRRITGLVRTRNLLGERTGDEAERRELSAEIGRLQWRLARIVQSEQHHQRVA